MAGQFLGFGIGGFGFQVQVFPVEPADTPSPGLPLSTLMFAGANSLFTPTPRRWVSRFDAVGAGDMRPATGESAS
jgi:hypothetical protein